MTGEPTTHRCAILIVDDDRDVQDVLRVALTAGNHAVRVAPSGRDALDHLRSDAETCAILLDLLLPGMSGAQFRAAQLRDRSLAWIPTILMSASADAEQAARDLKVAQLVRKPLDLEVVRRALSRFTGANCRRRWSPAELAGSEVPPLSSG